MPLPDVRTKDIEPLNVETTVGHHPVTHQSRQQQQSSITDLRTLLMPQRGGCSNPKNSLVAINR